MDSTKLAINMAMFMGDKGDIKNHIRYEEFMKYTKYNAGSLGLRVQEAEEVRIIYEKMRTEIAEWLEKLTK